MASVGLLPTCSVRKAHGWRSSIEMRARPRELKDKIPRGRETQAWQVDLSDAGRTEETLGAVTAHFGRVDVLVNNAATYGAKRHAG